MPFDWSPLWLTLRCAAAATFGSVLPGLPIAWVLAHRRFPGRELLDAAASLPLVLPPAVLAYYLLARLGRWPIVFNWNAAVVLSAIYTLPLAVRMSRAALEDVDHSFENAARSLGAPEWRVFWRITAPLARRAILAAVLGAFARSAADFGLTAIAASGTADARWIAASLIAIAASALFVLYLGNRLRRGRVWA